MPARSILLQSPISCRKGFLDVDDPPRGWGEPHSNIVSDSSTACSVLSTVDRTAPRYPDFPQSTPSPFYTFLSSTQSVLSSVHLSAFPLHMILIPYSIRWPTSWWLKRFGWSWLLSRSTGCCAGYLMIPLPVLYHYQLTPRASSPVNDLHRNAPMRLTSTPPTGCGRKR